MMNNLFSMFDPSTYYLSMSWISIIIPPMVISLNKFKNNTKWNNLFMFIKNKTTKEIMNLMKNNLKTGNIHMMMSLFMIMMISNLLAMMPMTFTPTAHICISFPMAMTMWASIMMFGINNYFKKMIIHLVPMGTPSMLMNFMVLIEMTSNLIRPITLSVRLTANMVAGHLLLSLLGNFMLNNFNYLIMSTIPLLILTILEMMVAIIQAYVFITLLTLYHNEIF